MLDNTTNIGGTGDVPKGWSRECCACEKYFVSIHPDALLCSECLIGSPKTNTGIIGKVPKGWSREDWEWVHQASDPDRWEDAEVLLADPARPAPIPPPDTDEKKKKRAEELKKKRDDDRDSFHEQDNALDPGDPIRSARALLDATYTYLEGHKKFRKLHRHRGAFWQWTGSCYRLADDETIRSEFWTFLEKKFLWEKKKVFKILPFKPKRAQVGDAIDALNGITQLDQYIEAPAWLRISDQKPADDHIYQLNGETHYFPPSDEFLACANGLLHLPTGELYVPTPDYFNISASDVMFDPAAPEPTQWLKFLEQIFENDEEAKCLLQDWFGYLLSPDTTQQKILLMVGPKRCGKGTAGRVLTAMLGKNSVGAPTMSNFGETFGMESLITKPAAIISDARIGARTDKSAVVERLLSISGEDSMTVPRKYNSSWTGKLPTRFTILTNELPSLSDGSGALAGRFVILILTKSFFGKEDPALTGKLLTELPGILNWALEGYRRLRQRGYFVQPKSSLEASEAIEMLASPTLAFVRECYDVGPGLTAVCDDMWEDWKLWSESQGRKDAGSKGWFGRNLQSAVSGLTISRPTINDVRVPTYVGIGIKPPGPHI
jgi:putative DNA primase/helicase